MHVQAHEDIVKFATVSVIDFFVDSHAEAGRLRCDVGIDKLEGIRPDGGVVESLGALKMFVAEGSVGGHSGIIVMFSVIFFKCLGTGRLHRGIGGIHGCWQLGITACQPGGCGGRVPS